MGLSSVMLSDAVMGITITQTIDNDYNYDGLGDAKKW